MVQQKQNPLRETGRDYGICILPGQTRQRTDRISDLATISQPRIIVTGFETDPAQVYAGSIFTLTIHVKNTSQDTAVSNVLFDLEAVEGGTETSSGQVTNSYASFLPTSGSSSIYVDRMPAGSSQDLKIEMQAKADLSQKPSYVVTVKMKYDTDLKADLTDEAKVSRTGQAGSKVRHEHSRNQSGLDYGWGTVQCHVPDL